MKECYIPVSITIPPLKYKLTDYLKDWPSNTQNKIFDNSFLNEDLLLFFKMKDVKIRENFVFWFWNTKQDRFPHTDGEWQSEDLIIRKRQCGINWNFTEDTWVEFYEFPADGNPEIKYYGPNDFSTVWKTASKIIDVWKEESPVIFNPQIPHMVRSDDSVTTRLSITLRFYESYESLTEKLKNYIDDRT